MTKRMSITLASEIADRTLEVVNLQNRSIALNATLMGLNRSPDCGVALLTRDEVAEDHLVVVRKALTMSGIDFEERNTDGPITVLQIAFTKRAPHWTPPAKWG